MRELGAILFGPPALLTHHSTVNLLVLRRFGATVGRGVRADEAKTVRSRIGEPEGPG